MLGPSRNLLASLSVNTTFHLQLLIFDSAPNAVRTPSNPVDLKPELHISAPVILLEN